MSTSAIKSTLLTTAFSMPPDGRTLFVELERVDGELGDFSRFDAPVTVCAASVT